MSDRTAAGGVAADRRSISERRAAEICRRHYFPPRRIRRLPGYENDNFRVEDEAARRFVLKASAPRSDRRRLEFELGLLEHLEQVGWTGAPRWIRTRQGKAIERVEVEGQPLEVRLLTWIGGRPWAEVETPSPSLVEALGDHLARLDLALTDFRRTLDPVDRPPPALWDLAEPSTWPSLDAVEPAADRRRVEAALGALSARLSGPRPSPRRGLIHADANDHNVLVSAGDGPNRIAGLIDFGDAGESVLSFEIAIAAAYVGLERADPWQPVPALVAAYSARLPLEETELELLLPAVRARLALSLAMSARRRRRGSADPYVLISERPARRSLALLSRLSDEEAVDDLAAAVRERSDG